MNHQNLRAVRKKTPLKQSDISFLLGINEDARISHWERGRRNPGIEIQLYYYILFGLPIRPLFEERAKAKNNELITRLKLRISQLQSSNKDARTISRIKYLEDTVERLTTQLTW